MLTEEIEFAISQYADGSLPADEVAALETILLDNAEARAMLESYRKLDAALKRELPLPAVKWDRLAGAISDAVADQERGSYSIKIIRWGSIAAAAMVLIAVGSVMFFGQRKPAGNVDVAIVTPPVTVSGEAIVEIAGPASEAAAQATVVEIAIGPSPEAQDQPLSYAAAEDLIYRAPRVVIASGEFRRQDSSAFPF